MADSNRKPTLDEILAEFDNKKSKPNAGSLPDKPIEKAKPEPVRENIPPAPKAEKLPPKPAVAENKPESISKPQKNAPAKTEQPVMPSEKPSDIPTDSTEKENVVKTKKVRHEEGVRVQSDSPLKLKLEQYRFLFKQLVKRDFKGRYKRAVLGVMWSMLSPMFTFAAQAIIFSVLFNRKGEHFISYLVIGNVVFHYFTDASTSGMFALASNGGIISKINVPKSIFLLSKNVSCFINFLLTMIIMFVISAIDGVHFSIEYFSLLYPMITMTVFNIGIGYVLSAWFVFFKDTQYLFSIFTQILMYFSAIFYRTSIFPETIQKVFFINPVYCYISYFREVIIDNTIPSLRLHFACLCFAILAVLAGAGVYKKNNNKFVYYF